MQGAKWGNSLVIRLTAAVVAALALKPGDNIEITLTWARVMALARERGRDDLLARLRGFRGLLPSSFKFDRDEADEVSFRGL